MRYLTEYNKFDNKSSKILEYNTFINYAELKENISDIIEDCKDSGLYVYSGVSATQSLATILISKKIFTKGFKFSDIEDSITHLVNYMASKGYNEITYYCRVYENNSLLTIDRIPNDMQSIEVFRMYFKLK